MNKIKRIGMVAVLTLALSLSINSHAMAALTLSATAVTGSTTASLLSTTTNAVTVDSGSTGAVNIGTGAAAKTITVGNDASTKVDVNALAVELDSAGTIVLNSTTTTAIGATTTIDLQATTGLTLDSAGSTAIGIGTDSATGAINVGTSATARTITVGNAASTLLDLNAISVDIDGAATGVTIDALDAGTINLGTSADAASDTSAINVGTSATARTITVGNAASTKVDVNALIIELDSAGTIILDSTTTTVIGATTTMDLQATTGLTLDSSGGAIGIGTDADAQNINIGTAGARVITLGSAAVTQIDLTTDGLGADGVNITGTVTTSKGITATTGDVVLSDGAMASANEGLSVLGASVTTFAVDSNTVTVTGESSGQTIATITGGVDGQLLTLIFVDTYVTITDTGTPAAGTVDLSAAFTSADDTVLQLVYDGTSWFEVSRSVN